MREINFRCFDKRRKSMVTWDSLIASGRIGIRILTEKEDENFSDWMQCTGLKDTNDIEIYEEDIISTHKHDFIVKWDEIGGMYLFHEINNPDSGIDYYEFEENYSYYGFYVIGNVYENPELLEDK